MPRENPTEPNATQCSHPSAETVALSLLKVRPDPAPPLSCGSNVNQATVIEQCSVIKVHFQFSINYFKLQGDGRQRKPSWFFTNIKSTNFEANSHRSLPW